MKLSIRALLSVAAITAAGGFASAQDLYDTSVLRTINITFTQNNWETLLRNNYAAQTNLTGTLTVDGVVYPDCGIRIRGNTSFTALPAGSQKFSLNIDMNDINPDQELLGYSSLNLNNGFHDPTFCREVLYNNYVGQYMPNMRANHVIVTINGQNWGVYNNVQQFNKTMLAGWFPDTSGLRIKCANNPNGPGLRYNGATAAGYTGYEIKDAGGFADPFQPLIAVCNVLTNSSTTNWMSTIDPTFAVDPSIWSVVFENILTDDDSYVNKGADFMTYRNPTDGRTYLLQTDANETYTQTAWSPTLNFAATAKPFLSRVLAVPELRQRYMAHYRTVMADLNWAYFEPRATALRAQIDAAVQADPKKLYTYALFQSNFTTSATLPYAGPAGGTVPGISQFLTQRTTSLSANAELMAQGPTISNVAATPAQPDPGNTVTISATVAPVAPASVARADLYYRPTATAGYQRVQMTNLGGNQYSALLPVVGAPGKHVDYYISATSTNTFGSLSFWPRHTEYDPLGVDFTFGASGGIRITEFMYSGLSGEFIEFTNFTSQPVDMTGWSFDDDHAIPNAFSLSAFGVLQPGEAAILTEANAETFRAAWNLPASVKIIGGLGTVGVGGNNLARNDQINLYNASGILSDRLTFGDQTFPGSIRTQNASGQSCWENLGLNSIAAWSKSDLGDAFGTFAASTGDRGTPGSYRVVSCFPVTCDADCNQDGNVDQGDVDYLINVVAGGDNPTNFDADFNQDGNTDQGDVDSLVNVVAGGPCP